MAQPIDYRRLYDVQDIVLNAGIGLDSGLYLTGGTCLHRFYTERRYSDDLDFFCSDNELFRDYVREYRESLKNAGMTETIEVDTRDFVRFRIAESLKIDFVNDRVYRYGRTERTASGYRIDNLVNLCANKLTAIIGRDEPKDIFDLHTISLIAEYQWSDIVSIARKKSVFETDYLIYRLRSFPMTLLDSLSVVNRDYIVEVKDAMPELINAILTDSG